MPLSSATSIYDPSAILDPNRGIPKVITTAQNAKTEARVDRRQDGIPGVGDSGSDREQPDPGLTGPVTGSIWIDTATHRVVKAVFSLPGSAPTRARP